jgi:hypothetical protein
MIQGCINFASMATSRSNSSRSSAVTLLNTCKKEKGSEKEWSSVYEKRIMMMRSGNRQKLNNFLFVVFPLLGTVHFPSM